MTISQNGWTNLTSPPPKQQVPGTNVWLTVHPGPPGDLLLYVAEQFDKRVEDIENARGTVDDGAWNYRPIAGSTVYSNHSSATAIDLNWSKHPLGASGTFTTTQVNVIREILAECSWAIRWGGNYSGRKDEMHFEVNTDWAGCQRAMDTINARKIQEEDMLYAHETVPDGFAYNANGDLINPSLVAELDFPPNVDLNGGWFAAGVDGEDDQSVKVRVALNVEDTWWDVKWIELFPGNRIHSGSFPLNRSYGKIRVGRQEFSEAEKNEAAATMSLGFAVAK